MSDLGTLANSLKKSLETAFDDADQERPTLPRCTPFGYRATESAYEQLTIETMRVARRCGFTGQQIADVLNDRQIFRRGRRWTAGSVCRVLRPYRDRRGTMDDDRLLLMRLDELKNF